MAIMGVDLKYNSSIVFDKATIIESVIIFASLKKVFDFLTDFSNHQKYSEVFFETRQTSEGKCGIGTTAIRKALIMSKKLEFDQEVVDFIEEKIFTVKNSSGLFHTFEEYSFEESELGTKVTIRVHGPTKGLLGIGVSIVLAKAQSSIRRDLQNLKKYVEEN